MSDFIIQSTNEITLNTNQIVINEHENKIDKYDINLDEVELRAVEEFLNRQNWPSYDAKNWNLAVKFLMARKFDVDRAIQLYKSHEYLRRKENLHLINLNDRLFLSDLESAKFTILPFLKNYPICALFTVRLHIPSETTELTTLKTLIYQLDGALENPDAQRNGIIFIYDMNDCKRSNYDLALSQKILTLIKGNYPARLKKLLVVSAPFWFKCLVKVLSVLMRDKIRDRVIFVDTNELREVVPMDILPTYLGGNVVLNHKLWLSECNHLVKNRASTCSSYYYMSSMSQNNGNSYDTQNGDLNLNRKRPLSDSLEKNKQKIFISDTNGNVNNPNEIIINDVVENGFYDISPNNIIINNEDIDFNIEDDSIHQEDTNGMKIEELIEYIRQIGVSGIHDEYRQVRLQSPASTCDIFKSKVNASKNRYIDVVCLDHTRVRLDTDDSMDISDDYIHANYVDGYKQKNAYISTQGPLDHTCEEFWRMIWQEKCVVIVMTTKVREQRKIKCAQYWPLEENEVMCVGDLFEIKNVSIDVNKEEYLVTKLEIRNLKTNKIRELAHCQYVGWPDHGVPKTACDMLEFLHVVRHNQMNYIHQLEPKWSGHPLGPPIVVHCSAGIGRTGTFCTIDISINRLLDTKIIDIYNTVSKIRTQRASSVQTPDQYVFCYMAIIEYAIQENLLDYDIDLNELFNN